MKRTVTERLEATRELLDREARYRELTDKWRKNVTKAQLQRAQREAQTALEYQGEKNFYNYPQDGRV